jgi:hypothetical protein
LKLPRVSAATCLRGFAILFLLALVLFAYVGLFSRYLADDYCYVASVNRSGFLRFQIGTYAGWQGRFSFSFLQAVAGLIGPSSVPILPAMALACWLLATTWAVYEFALIASWPRPILSAFVCAELIIFSTLNGTDNIAQSLYWQAGMLTYIPPLICLPLTVGLVLLGTRRRLANRMTWPLAIASLLLSFIAGGFSEPYSLMQVGGLFIAGTLIYKFAEKNVRRAALPLIIAGLSGAVAALVVVVIAPGNIVRQGFFPAPPDLITLTGRSLYFSALFIFLTLLRSPLTSFAVVSLPVLLGYFLNQSHGNNTFHWPRVKRQLLFSPFIGYLLISLCAVPGFYGTSVFLPERARIIPRFLLICLAVYWCYFAGAALTNAAIAKRMPLGPSKAVLVGSLVLIIAAPLLSVGRTFSLVRNARAAASIWDQTDQELHAARKRGEMDVTIPAVYDVESRLGAAFTELQLERDPQNRKNKCAARYYGLNSITAK